MLLIHSDTVCSFYGIDQKFVDHRWWCK